MSKFKKMIRVYLLGMMTFLSSVSFAQTMYYDPDYLSLTVGDEVYVELIINTGTYGDIVDENEEDRVRLEYITLEYAFVGSVSDIQYYVDAENNRVTVRFRYNALSWGSDKITVCMYIETVGAHEYHYEHIDVMVWVPTGIENTSASSSSVDLAETVKSEALKEED